MLPTHRRGRRGLGALGVLTQTHQVEHTPGQLGAGGSCTQEGMTGQADLGKPGIAKQFALPTRCSLLILKQVFCNKKV